MFDAPIANLKHKLDLAVKSTIGGVVAGACALVALAFFCAALFLWLSERYGPIVAAIVLGCAFTILALVAVIVILILHRRNPPPPPPRKAAWWADPALLAAALDVSRTFGRKRLTSVVVLGAFAIGMLLQVSRKRDDKSAE